MIEIWAGWNLAHLVASRQAVVIAATGITNQTTSVCAFGTYDREPDGCSVGSITRMRENGHVADE